VRAPSPVIKEALYAHPNSTSLGQPWRLCALAFNLPPQRPTVRICAKQTHRPPPLLNCAKFPNEPIPLCQIPPNPQARAGAKPAHPGNLHPEKTVQNRMHLVACPSPSKRF
jgi:hypothetical protein